MSTATLARPLNVPDSHLVGALVALNPAMVTHVADQINAGPPVIPDRVVARVLAGLFSSDRAEIVADDPAFIQRLAARCGYVAEPALAGAWVSAVLVAFQRAYRVRLRTVS